MELTMSRYLVVMPDDSSQPILDAINHATQSLRIKMFTFSDPHLLHAVIAAHRRGVKVRIMLNPARRSGEAENEASRKMLTEAGVEVIDSNPAFDLTHERYQDPVIIERLVRANHRGVKVHVLARPPHKLKKEKLVEGVGGLRILDDVGIKVHRLKGLKLHAKLLFGDGVRAIIGSINLAPGSFDSRRELAIEVHDGEIVDRLHSVVHQDWENSRPMDLTDEGLMAELEDKDEHVAEDLAIQTKKNSG